MQTTAPGSETRCRIEPTLRRMSAAKGRRIRLIDLHQHSIYSDGTSTLAELVERAVALNLTAMSLTDHDTTAGLEECARLAAEAGVPFIRGVEFEASEGPHVLGYYGSSPGPAVAEAERGYRRFRIEGVMRLLESLVAIGFELDADSVIERAATGTPFVSHIVAEMQHLGYLSSLDRSTEEFARLFGPDGPAAIPDLTDRQWPVVELIQMLRESGAAPVLAHPYARDLALLPEMVEAGLQGVEAYNRNAHLNGDVAGLKRAAREHGLIMTGGWDYHGEAQAARIARSDLSKFAPPDELLEPLLYLLAVTAA